MPFTKKQHISFGGPLPRIIEVVEVEEYKDGQFIRRREKRFAPTDTPHYSEGNIFRRMELGEPLRRTKSDVLNPERPEILANEIDSINN